MLIKNSEFIINTDKNALLECSVCHCLFSDKENMFDKELHICLNCKGKTHAKTN